ncbi:MAG: DNA-directed RNA polymerase subunit H [Candidatus Nanoarchaeia archaeon]
MAEEIKSSQILNHFLVPQHIVLSEEEAKALLERFNISPFQLPILLANDPIAKTIGAKPGNIVKIIRKGLLNKYEYYRYVK